jgi:hypothetical protein
VSEAGVTFGKVGHDYNIVEFPPSASAAGYGYKRIDIMVPARGNDDRIRLFATRQSDIVQLFPELEIRLLVTSQVPGRSTRTTIQDGAYQLSRRLGCKSLPVRHRIGCLCRHQRGNVFAGPCAQHVAKRTRQADVYG